VTVMSVTRIQNSGGSGTIPRKPPNGVNGNIVPRATKPIISIANHFPGRLVRKGMRLVLMTNIINTSVQKDSMNHALWNNAAR